VKLEGLSLKQVLTDLSSESLCSPHIFVPSLTRTSLPLDKDRFFLLFLAITAISSFVAE